MPITFLYIFPHPDDESFGVAHVMNKQLREGHKVYLLTLTRGEATKQRLKFGYSLEEMGEVRYKEMLDVEKTLGLTGMTVLNYPDNQLQHLDPRELEHCITEYFRKIEPDVVISYPVYGISGFYDHLVTHAIVKRAFVAARETMPFLQRLAFHGLTEEHAKCSPHFPLKWSAPDDIDCIISLNDEDINAACNALDCYVTFQETIEQSGIKAMLRKECVFEIFDEDHRPVLSCLSEKLQGYGR